ncbi:MAG: IS3 family transposase, partial [Acetobacteraceae bacterium]|nr:IS3 family transposase [Acetobacteraceae bacterium]
THGDPIAPNVVDRDFHADAPNRTWVTDVTCVWTAQGWLFLAAILDLFSRRVVGWAMADHLGHELALAALDMAIARRRPAPGLVHHSDRGVRYAARGYRARLQEHGMLCSMSSKGDCWGNAPMESFFAAPKGELVDERDYLIPARLAVDLFEVRKAGQAAEPFGAEAVPSGAEGVDDGVVAPEEAVAEVSLA